MDEWIDVDKQYPPEGEYVLIWVDGYVGISRYIDGDWECGSFSRRPMFKKDDSKRSKLDAELWMPLPEPPKEKD